jgi:hypothetical protein
LKKAKQIYSYIIGVGYIKSIVDLHHIHNHDSVDQKEVIMFESRIERVLALKSGVTVKKIEQYYLLSNNITVIKNSF